MARRAGGEGAEDGEQAQMATAQAAEAGALVSMIPPSTFLVLSAILAQVSVAEMLAAGIVPGILSAIAYVVWIMYTGWRMQREDQVVTEANSVQGALDEAS